MRPQDLIRLRWFSFAMLMTVAGTPAALAQTRAYPGNMRGYKVERTVVEVKSTKNNNSAANKGAQSDDSNVDQLITFGTPTLARVTPLGITSSSLVARVSTNASKSPESARSDAATSSISTGAPSVPTRAQPTPIPKGAPA